MNWAAQVVVGDLDGLDLGATEDEFVTIDVDAAGHGWFIDPTPTRNEEFLGAGGELLASIGPATAGIDLLTVVAHELGHVAGLEHDDHGVMEATLGVEVRHLPETEDGDSAAPSSSSATTSPSSGRSTSISASDTASTAVRIDDGGATTGAIATTRTGEYADSPLVPGRTINGRTDGFNCGRSVECGRRIRGHQPGRGKLRDRRRSHRPPMLGLFPRLMPAAPDRRPDGRLPLEGTADSLPSKASERHWGRQL